MDQASFVQWLRAGDFISEEIVAWCLPVALVIITWRIAFGDKDGTKEEDRASVVSRLLTDSRGRLSLARAQMLLVTLASLALYVDLSLEAGSLAEIPGTLLALVGFSHATFVISLALEAEPATTKPDDQSDSSRKSIPSETPDPSAPAAAAAAAAVPALPLSTPPKTADSSAVAAPAETAPVPAPPSSEKSPGEDVFDPTAPSPGSGQ